MEKRPPTHTRVEIGAGGILSPIISTHFLLFFLMRLYKSGVELVLWESKELPHVTVPIDDSRFTSVFFWRFNE